MLPTSPDMLQIFYYQPVKFLQALNSHPDPKYTQKITRNFLKKIFCEKFFFSPSLLLFLCSLCVFLIWDALLFTLRWVFIAEAWTCESHNYWQNGLLFHRPTSPSITDQHKKRVLWLTVTTFACKFTEKVWKVSLGIVMVLSIQINGVSLWRFWWAHEIRSIFSLSVTLVKRLCIPYSEGVIGDDMERWQRLLHLLFAFLTSKSVIESLLYKDKEDVLEWKTL